MTHKIQTGGYVTGFRVGEMILENGGKLPIAEIEYGPNPTSPNQERMSVQLAFRSAIANSLIQQLQQKLGEVEHNKTAMS